MRKIDQYTDAIGTIYPDGYERERIFRDAGDMLEPVHAGSEPATLIGRLYAWFSVWRMKRAGRLALRELSDEQLVDIGVTRQQALTEVAKSYFPSWPSRPL
jgi:uncharacterized protein YjiS (DUF1127 family)